MQYISNQRMTDLRMLTQSSNTQSDNRGEAHALEEQRDH